VYNVSQPTLLQVFRNNPPTRPRNRKCVLLRHYRLLCTAGLIMHNNPNTNAARQSGYYMYHTATLPPSCSQCIHQFISPSLGPGRFCVQFRNPTQSVGYLRWGISPSQGRYLHTEQKHIHLCHEWDSNPRPQRQSGHCGSLLRPASTAV
jgi:hypothetical protein